MRYHNRLRDLREDRDMTQKQIATIFNMSQTGYSKYETGENDIPTSILIRLALFYETSIDYILGFTDEKNHTKEKNRINGSTKRFKRWFRRRFRSVLMVSPFGITLVVSVGLFLFAFVFRWILVAQRNNLHKIREILDKEFWSFTRADQGIDTWFAFFGSYFGVIATVVLGIITLRFSFWLGQREQVAKVRGIKIKEMYLYDIFSDFTPSQWKHSDTRKYRFLLKIVLKECDSIYNFEINEIFWGNCNKDFGYKVREKMSDYKVYVDYGGDIVIYIYFNELETRTNSTGEKKKDTVSYFYHMQEYEPLLLEKYELCRRLEINMKLTDQIWIKKQKPNEFWVKYTIVIENNIKLENCIELHEISHKMEISNSPYSNN